MPINKIVRILKNNKKFIFGIAIGIVISGVSVYEAANIISARYVTYSNTTSGLTSNNIQDAVDELYGHATDYSSIDTRVTNIENNFLNKTYPVGSIFLSATLSDTTAVHNAIGGTWEVFGAGRTIISANSTYPINTTGGSTSHQHKYGFQYAGYYREVLMESVADAGVLNYSNATSYTIPAQTTSIAASNATAIAANSSTTATISSANLQANRYTSIGNTSETSVMPPYITVYMYKRTG